MNACVVCGDPLTGPHVGGAAHAACFAARLPHDAALAVALTLALVLAPAVVVWAA